MKKVFSTRKGIILLAQVFIVLAILSILLLSQIGAFARTDNTSTVSSQAPQEVAPTMLVATKTPAETEPAEEEPAPPAEGDSFGGNAGGSYTTQAYQECETWQRDTFQAMVSASGQADQIWNQINALRISASTSQDPETANTLNAQADALQPEADRLYSLSNQLRQELFQDHHSLSCGPDGPIRSN